MALPAINFFSGVRLTLRSKKDNTTTDIDLVSTLSENKNNSWYPILLNVAGLGASVREGLPSSSRGSILIDNSLDTFAKNKRFSDLLEEYTLIEQNIKFYLSQKALDDEPDSFSDLDQIWQAQCTSLSWSRNNRLRINFSKTSIQNRTISKIITKSEFPNAPEESLGRHLPLIIGERSEVDSVIVRGNYTESSRDKIDIAYGVTFGDKYIPSGTGSDLADVKFFNSITNRFEDVTFVDDAFTEIYKQPIVPPGGLHIGSVRNIWDFFLAFAYQLKPGQNVTGGELIAGINWYLALSSTGDVNGDGQYTMTVYDEANGYPGKEIAKSTVEIGSSRIQFLGSQSGFDMYTFRFFLDRLIQIPHNQSVFVGLTRYDPDDNFLPLQDDGASGGGGISPAFEKYLRFEPDLGRGDEWERQIRDSGRDHFDVWGVARSEGLSGGSSSNYQKGLGHVQLSLEMRTQDFVPSLENERFLISSKGMKDDSSGTITGSANSLIKQPRHVLELLMHEWNGSNWVDNLSDLTKFSNTHDLVNGGSFSINIQGSTQGRAVLTNVIQEIAQTSMCQIVPLRDGKLALFFYGTKRSVTASFDDERINLDSISTDGVQTVVNSARFLYARGLQTRTESLLAEGGFRQHNGSYVTNDNTPMLVKISPNSQTLYGVRETRDEVLNWLGDEDSVIHFAGLFLTKHQSPKSQIILDIKYDNGTELEILDKINIYSDLISSITGSAQEAMFPVNTTGDDSQPITSGHYFKRGKKNTCAITGLQLVLNSQSVPVYRVTTEIVGDGEPI